MSKEQSQTQQNPPFQLPDVLMFGDAFSESVAARMKQIDAHMKQIDENMTEIGKSLQGQPTKTQGENRKLILQFDVSQFDASEVTVTILDGKLTVSASHEEKTGNTHTVRQYHKELYLPQAIDPKTIVSSFSKDGVLVIEAPSTLKNL